jgi:MFS family permease
LTQNEIESRALTLLSPLGNATFRTIFLASQISNIGWLMQIVAIGWLMTTNSASAVMIALVQSAATLPIFLLGGFVGAVTDNYNRRMLLIVGRSIMMAAAATLTLLIAVDITQPWIILLLSFVDGCGVAISNPAWNASLGDIVERRHLPGAVALQAVGFNLGRSIGPALGGMIVGAFGPLAVFALTALGFVAPLVALWRNKWEVKTPSSAKESIANAIWDGIRFSAISPEIRTTMLRGALFGFASTSMLALLPLVARDTLKCGPFGYGILMGGFGAGALFAGVAAPGLRKRFSQEWLIALASFACAACVILMAFTSSVSVAAICLVVGGFGWTTSWSGLDLDVQLASPRWVVGRTSSLYSALIFGGIAAGSWFWGLIASDHSLSVALVASGIATLATAGLGLKFPINVRATTELEPSGESFTPKVALTLTPRSGPIVVSTKYAISEENAEQFVRIMQVRRHALSRVGARRWTLAFDIQKPSNWTETYRTPTWADFDRLHRRLTVADRDLDEQVSRLSQSNSLPQTDFLIDRSAERRPDLRVKML